MLWWLLACTGWGDGDEAVAAARAAIPPALGDGAVKRAVVVTTPGGGLWEPIDLPSSEALDADERLGVVAVRIREDDHPWLAPLAAAAWHDRWLASAFIERDAAACERLGDALIAAAPSPDPSGALPEATVELWGGLAGCPEPLRTRWVDTPAVAPARAVLLPSEAAGDEPLLNDLPSLVRWGPPPHTWAARYPQHRSALRQAAGRCAEHDDDPLVAERCLAGVATLSPDDARPLAAALLARADGTELPVATELQRWPTDAARATELDALGFPPLPVPAAGTLVDALEQRGRAFPPHPSHAVEVHLRSLLDALGIEGVVIDARRPMPTSPHPWVALHAHLDGQRHRVLVDPFRIDTEQVVAFANVLADRAEVPDRAMAIEHVDGPRIVLGPEAALDTLLEAGVVYRPPPSVRWTKAPLGLDTGAAPELLLDDGFGE